MGSHNMADETEDYSNEGNNYPPAPGDTDTAVPGPGDPGWGGDIGTDTDPGISDPGDAEFPSVVDPLTLSPAQQAAP